MIDRPKYDAWLRDVLAKVRALPPPPGKWNGTPDVLGQVLRSDRLQRSGTWCEFGVADGSTLRRIAPFRGSACVWGFDTFSGLPEEWVRRDDVVHLAGHFAQERVPLVAGAHLVTGLFQDTLPSWCPPEPVTFAHVDCDLGSATRCVLDHVGPKLAPGAFVAFDEALEYPGHEEHEILALYEAELKGLRWEPVFAGGERLAIVCAGPVVNFPIPDARTRRNDAAILVGDLLATALDPPEVDPSTGRDPGAPEDDGTRG